MDVCEICGRQGTPLTRHHLLPRSRHRKARFQRQYTREEALTAIAMLCRSCHSCVHGWLSEKELEQTYNTVEALRAHPGIADFAAWLSNKPAGFQPLFRKPLPRRR